MGNGTVSAVVTNFNNYSDAKETIEGLRKQDYDDLKIILADDCSADGSYEKLKSEFPSIEAIQNDTNSGSAFSNNRGIELSLKSGSEYIWILNNDLVFPNESVLKNLVELLETRDNIGVVSPRLMSYPETDEVWFEQGIINWKVGDAYHRSYFTPILHGFKNQVSTGTDIDGVDVIINEYIPVCCALFKSDVFKETGFLDQEYFFYYEDTDYCVGMSNNNYDIITYKGVEVYHKESMSSGSTPYQSYYTQRNRILFYRNNCECINTLGFILTYLLKFILMILFEATRGNDKNIKYILFGVYDGIRGKKGKKNF